MSKTDQEITRTQAELAAISGSIVELEDRRAASLRAGDFAAVESVRTEIDRMQKRASDLAERLLLLERDAEAEAAVRAAKERKRHIADIDAKFLKPRLEAAREFSKHFAAAVESYRRLASLSNEALTASGLSLPPAETAAGLNGFWVKLVTSHEMYRMGAAAIETGKPFTGASVPSLPPAAVPDLSFIGQPEKIRPLVEIVISANEYALQAMSGDRNVRTGNIVSFAQQTARTANQEKLAQLTKQQNMLANAPSCDEVEYARVVSEIAQVRDLVEAETTKGAA
jgi:hypothetical protein